MIPMRRGTKRSAAVVADVLLRGLAPVLTRGRSAGPLPERPRVLVVRCDHIGDAAMASGAVAALRDALRPSELHVLAGPWAAPLFQDHPAVDRVIAYPTPWWLAARRASAGARVRAWLALPRLVATLRAERYDVAVDLRGDLRQILCFLALSGARERVSTDRTGGAGLLTRAWPFDASLHEVEKDFRIAALLGAAGPPRLAAPAVPALAAELDAALDAARGPHGVIALSLRGTEPNRAWPVSHAAALVDLAAARLGVGSVYVGGPGDRAFGDAIAAAAARPLLNLAGRTALPETLAVLRRAAAAVTVDSGPMHLAALAGTPTVALFGPGDPAECRPWGVPSRIATTGAPCGCIHPVCDHAPPGPGRCLVRLEPGAVVDALAALLAEVRG